MFPVLGSLVDFLHALLMVAWVLGLPLLFLCRRYPRAARWYAAYAVVFIVLNQASRFLLGECFLTTVARFFWEHGGAPPSAPGEWFTVRLARAVFHLTPSHRAITVVSELLIGATAIGMLVSTAARRRGARSRSSRPA